MVDAYRQIEMTLEQWDAIPDNPRQRNTEARIKKATHLLNPSPTHRHVHMAETNTGERCKLDGHTRSGFWKEHPDLAPQSVYVNCYFVDDIKNAAADLYTHFDNPAATENSSDRVFGAMREIGFSPISELFLRYKIGNAVRIASIYMSGKVMSAKKSHEITYDAIKEFSVELALLDSIYPTQSKMISPFIVAALLTIRKHGDRILTFWDDYIQDRGFKIGDSADPVEALTRLRNKHHAGGRMDKGSIIEYCGKALTAAEGWINKAEFHKGGLRMTNPVEYCKEMHLHQKKIRIKDLAA